MATTSSGAALAETPDTHGAYPRLTKEQIAKLEQYGERRPTIRGQVLFREGDPSYDFHVVLDGKVAIVDPDADGERLIAVHGPRRFLGELSLLTGQAAFYTAIVREPGEVLVVPVGRLRQIVALDASLGDLILRAYLLRREQLVGIGAGFQLIGSRFSPDSRRLREFAARNRLPHSWIDLEDDQHAEALLQQLGVAPEDTPVVIWGGKLLRNPSNKEMGRALGLKSDVPPSTVRDLIVVGSGPAGLAASVYAASAGLSTMSIDSIAAGGQASTTSRIENYLGFPSGISGSELAERATIQAQKFGARLIVPCAATALERDSGMFRITMDDGSQIETRTLLIATGARYRKLPVARLDEFEANSVYYAATLLEAQLCHGDPVVVVGGGNSAGQATLFLAEHAAKVTLVIRHHDVARDMSRYLADRIERRPDIDVLRDTEVTELVGQGRLEAVVVRDLETHERRVLDARALFVFIGADPHTGWLGGVVELDDHGFIRTGRDAGRTLPLETSMPGMYAAGDVRCGSIKRVASAVGEGAMAVRFVHEFLEGESGLMT
jgi:thioredoxin reductase (NADPH)